MRGGLPNEGSKSFAFYEEDEMTELTITRTLSERKKEDFIDPSFRFFPSLTRQNMFETFHLKVTDAFFARNFRFQK